LIQKVKTITGFRPANLHLYKLAFRHKSVAQEVVKGVRNSNERLEFLGDAVLGSVMADFLFRRYPTKDEGFLTQMRSKFVSRAHLNKLSQKMGLDKLIVVENDGNNVYRSMNGDAFEAFIGAIYVDRGYDATRKVILNRIIKYYIDIEELEAREVNYKSKLLEWAQKEKTQLEFFVAQEKGKGYSKQYVIEARIDGVSLGSGQGFSIKEAEQSAAQNAYLKLTTEPQ
jgi:ribonuclease-3